MATISLGKAVLEIIADAKQFSVDDPLRKIRDLTGISQQSLNALAAGAGLAVGGITAVTGAIVALAMRGGELASIQGSFNSLTAAIGESGDEMLSVTRSATKGLIKDLDIMAAANKAMLLGLPVTSESMATMAEAATVLGRAMKQDAGKSLDDLTTALGRGSPLILDNLGLTVKVGEAQEAYARKLGKATSALTDGEKKMAFYEAAMEAARAKVAELGGVHLTVADQITRAINVFRNLHDGLSIAIAQSPVLAAGLTVIGEAFTGALGAQQSQQVQTLARLVGDFAIGLTYLGDTAVFIGQRISEIFALLKVTIASVGVAIAFILEASVKQIAEMLALAGKLPFVGDQFREAAAGAKEMGLYLEGMRKDYQAQVGEAIDGAARQKAALDQVGQAIGKTRAAMQAARNVQVDVTTTTKAQAAAHVEAAASTEEQRKALAKLIEQSKKLAPAVDSVKAALELADAGWQQSTERWTANMGTVLSTFSTLQSELTRLQLSGTEQRLFDLEEARAKELEGLAHLKETHRTEYEQIAAMVNEKYDVMRGQALGTYGSIEQRARAMGYATRGDLAETAKHAKRMYDEMAASGQFTAEELTKAWEAHETARRAAAGETRDYQVTAAAAIVDGTLQVFSVLGQRYKAAAIAGAVISTYQAIAKALASAPWPFNLALAAGAAAAGWANVSKIRSSDAGFREGTPGLDFASFGRETYVPLHGDEAVIPRGGGHQLATEIARSMRGMGGRLAGAVGGVARELVVPVTLQLDGRTVARKVIRLQPRELALMGLAR